MCRNFRSFVSSRTESAFVGKGKGNCSNISTEKKEKIFQFVNERENNDSLNIKTNDSLF